MSGTIEHKCPLCSEAITRDDWKIVSDISSLKAYRSRADPKANVAVGIENYSCQKLYTDMTVDVHLVSVDTATFTTTDMYCSHGHEHAISSSSRNANSPIAPANNLQSGVCNYNYDRVIPGSLEYMLYHTEMDIQLLELFRLDCVHESKSYTNSIDAECDFTPSTKSYLSSCGEANADAEWIPYVIEANCLLSVNSALEQTQRWSRERLWCTISLVMRTTFLT